MADTPVSTGHVITRCTDTAILAKGELCSTVPVCKLVAQATLPEACAGGGLSHARSAQWCQMVKCPYRSPGDVAGGNFTTLSCVLRWRADCVGKPSGLQRLSPAKNTTVAGTQCCPPATNSTRRAQRGARQLGYNSRRNECKNSHATRGSSSGCMQRSTDLALSLGCGRPVPQGAPHCIPAMQGHTALHLSQLCDHGLDEARGRAGAADVGRLYGGRRLLQHLHHRALQPGAGCRCLTGAAGSNTDACTL